jgi:hypothetical protein
LTIFQIDNRKYANAVYNTKISLKIIKDKAYLSDLELTELIIKATDA